jgi:SAM-dependent methyltransferase
VKPALLANKPAYPRNWRDLPIGEDIKVLLEGRLEDLCRHFFGYHLVKLGDLSSQLELRSCPIKHVVTQTDRYNPVRSLVSSSHQLPFAENSIDAFILAHELDFAQDPHQIIREIDRCIMPNGHLVVIGFNPFSPAGLLKYLPINRHNVLHEARFFSHLRINDWLQLLGFEIVDLQHLMFSELFFERKVNDHSRFQLWSERYIPFLSSIYIIVAKKRVLPLSLIKTRWKAKPSFSPLGASIRVR